MTLHGSYEDTDAFDMLRIAVENAGGSAAENPPFKDKRYLVLQDADDERQTQGAGVEVSWDDGKLRISVDVGCYDTVGDFPTSALLGSTRTGQR